MCSTPFGITEVGTEDKSREREAHAVCSTPFGITEVGTVVRHVLFVAHQVVLNAFRHHRGRHPPVNSPGPVRVDVLNAFRHHRGRHRVTPPSAKPFACAQRLSASQRSAPSRRATTFAGWPSAQRLSASQRSARSRPRSIRPRREGAQRLSASQRSAPRRKHRTDMSSECSTPFGITEVGTPLARKRPVHQRRGVLNAFRHHRGRHARRA